MKTVSQYERINFTLPKDTVRLLKHVPSGKRSQVVNRVLRKYLHSVQRTELERDLQESALLNAKEDLKMAAEWRPLEDEVWNKLAK